mmetsp:Transcript_12656/g.18970  ORF Transcript_12656/g.18970 Transcript_12656/m.18970 type:complete len:1082 (+) Transcript_12656:24-3269(+)|eukprot:CAMPEP_0197316876 /NCGR_PEP_ID=MMETSP0891-20130614/44606_1 /TAXON_ID=44058 ORGANISM="Aureoumbra lagunensis, Strain CCMP1510" /NCGR_SAMPLE_ID=MMETSP0891 /ASSEMBLY_ACC=CAM_ASM_000534 /LENGTH=1081 /DNA_ID=CAMNT_0042806565 /DNA_START=19 /DNA_END=3264 /DNA_ORIENTATION=+
MNDHECSDLEIELENVVRRRSPRYTGTDGRAIEGLAREVREVLMNVEANEVLNSSITTQICIAKAAKNVACKITTLECAVVGSWLTRTCARRKDVGLDICATMSGIVAKDYLNGRYWQKRWQYCLGVKSQLEEKKNHLNVAIENLCGDARRPVLIVTHKNAESTFYLRILPCVPDGILPLIKLTPKSNAIRGSNGAYDFSTYKHNNAMLRERDLVMKRHVSLVFQAIKKNPIIGDVIVLAKSWLLSACPDVQLDGTAIALLCLHAMYSNANHISRLALFRCFLRLISERWGPDQPLTLVFKDSSYSNTQEDSDWSADTFRAAGHDLVALDLSARVNLASRLSVASFHELKNQAQIGLKAARVDAPISARCALFTERPIFSRYDAIITLPLWPQGTSEYTALQAAPGDVEQDMLGESLIEYLSNFTASVVQQALEERASTVLVIKNQDKTQKNHITIGVRLLEDSAFRPALRGPFSEESQKVIKFRYFWGDKAETRRFRDGETREAVVWTNNNNSEFIDWRRSIPERCVRYALDRHLSSRCISDRRFLFDSPLYAKMNKLALNVNSFDTLIRYVDTLDLAARKSSLPLRLDALSPADACLRGTDPRGIPEPNISLAPPGCIQNNNQIIEILLIARFERSAKWITLETQTARSAAATALLARLARKLATDDSLANHLRFIAFATDSNELRIGFAGFLFRIKPDFPQPQDNGLLQFPNLAAVHHSTIRALTAKYPGLAPTIRLLARWSASQLLSSHFSHEILELLAVAVFISPSFADAHDCLGFATAPPISPVSGFLSCLRLLWKRDWSTKPLFLALRQAVAASSEHLLWSPPKTSPPQYPLSIVAGYDDDFFQDNAKRAQAAAWTGLSKKPELPVLRLAQAAAKNTERLVSQENISFKDEDDAVLESIFGAGAATGRVTKRTFDAWLVVRKSQRKSHKKVYANLDNPAARLAFATDRTEAVLDPALSPFEYSRQHAVDNLVRELISCFNDVALFFYNHLEPSIIGIVWRPNKPQPLATMQSAYTQPAESPDPKDDRIYVQPNFDQILVDIRQLAGDLVTAVKQRAEILDTNHIVVRKKKRPAS